TNPIVWDIDPAGEFLVDLFTAKELIGEVILAEVFDDGKNGGIV
ncbi:hypothetical protein A2U01_0074256, partial [Trifolium medium]|nr:hypothetical protein [Trifolium medium]